MIVEVAEPQLPLVPSGALTKVQPLGQDLSICHSLLYQFSFAELLLYVCLLFDPGAAP